jgi:protein-S-isoprenylcysteine O-methyltransferase Ste14
MNPGKFTSYCWLVLAAFWIIAARDTKRTIERGQSRSVRRLSLLVIVAGFLLYYLPLSKAPVLGFRLVAWDSPVRMVGEVLCVLGVLFAIWARIILARNWSAMVTLKEDHTLIRKGPYSLVRHPIYTGIYAGMIGTALAIGELRAFLPLLNIIPIWIKMNSEEALMLKAFPNEYPDYQKNVRRLVPWLI